MLEADLTQAPPLDETPPMLVSCPASSVIWPQPLAKAPLLIGVWHTPDLSSSTPCQSSAPICYLVPPTLSWLKPRP